MTPENKKRISIVVPVYNEELSIAPFLNRFHEIATQIPNYIFDIIFIDDGSRDSTCEAVRQTIQKYPYAIRLIKLSRNFGKEAALAAGVQHTQGHAVVTMDVDLQDPPDLLPDMIKLWENGAKIVFTTRCDRQADTYFKRLTSGLFYKVYNLLSRVKLNQHVSDFLILDRQVVDVINTLPERIRFMKGIVPWVGFRQETLSFVRPERKIGTSKWKYWALWNFALDGITGASTVPLRIWTYLGFASALFAFIYAFYIFFKTIFFGIDVPGYASTIIFIQLFGGLNMISVGVLGEYVGRIYIESRQRPVYIIETIEG